MARPDTSNEREAGPRCEPLIALVRLLARQAAAEALDASAVERAPETPSSSESEQ